MSLTDLDRRVPIDVVVGLPGWTVRVALLVVGLALALVAPERGHPLPLPIILALLALGTTGLPGTPVPGVQLGFACIVRISTGHDAVDGRLLGTALLIVTVHLLSSLAAVIPLDARLDPRALLPSARRLGIVVLAFVPVALAARFVGPGSGSDLLFLLAALGCAALVGLALVAGARRP